MASQIMYTCGICSNQINQALENLWEHDCYIPFNTGGYQLMTDDRNILKPYIIGGNAENITNNCSDQNQNNTVKADNSLLSDENSEMLIEAVSRRPCLWNYKLPIQQRLQAKREAAWKEISEDFEGKWSLDTLKYRWKDLRDSYMKAYNKSKQYVPSGSSAKASRCKKVSYKFYDVMSFLSDQNDFESVSSVAPLREQNVQPGSSKSNNSVETSTSKRKRSIETHDKFEQFLIESIQPANEKDSLEGFLIMLGDNMRKLPNKTQRCLQRKFLQEVHEELDLIEE